MPSIIAKRFISYRILSFLCSMYRSLQGMEQPVIDLSRTNPAAKGRQAFLMDAPGPLFVATNILEFDKDDKPAFGSEGDCCITGVDIHLRGFRVSPSWPPALLPHCGFHFYLRDRSRPRTTQACRCPS